MGEALCLRCDQFNRNETRILCVSPATQKEVSITHSSWLRIMRSIGVMVGVLIIKLLGIREGDERG